MSSRSRRPISLSRCSTASLLTEARPHDPQRGREGAHQGRDRAAGRNRGRRCHSCPKSPRAIVCGINRILFSETGPVVQGHLIAELSNLVSSTCIGSNCSSPRPCCSGLNERRLGHEPDHFASRHLHALLRCAGSYRFKCDMDRCHDRNRSDSWRPAPTAGWLAPPRWP